MSKRLLLLLGLLVCAGCGRYVGFKKNKDADRGTPGSASSFVCLSEARLADVPFPLGAKINDLSLCSAGETERKAQSAVVFETALAKAEVLNFYQCQMERQGWKELVVFDIEDEALVVYEKPFKYAVVSVIRGSAKRFLVRVFISAR